MTNPKHDGAWLLKQAREIFEVIGWPHITVSNRWNLVMRYEKEVENWIVEEYNAESSRVRHFSGYRSTSEAARFIRGYLREKLRGKMCFVQDEIYGGPTVVVKRMTQPGFYEYLRKDGLWVDNAPDSQCYFNSENEAIIKAAKLFLWEVSDMELKWVYTNCKWVAQSNTKVDGMYQIKTSERGFNIRDSARVLIDAIDDSPGRIEFPCLCEAKAYCKQAEEAIMIDESGGHKGHIYCHECSKAGGAERAIHHLPAACGAALDVFPRVKTQPSDPAKTGVKQAQQIPSSKKESKND